MGKSNDVGCTQFVSLLTVITGITRFTSDALNRMVGEKLKPKFLFV